MKKRLAGPPQDIALYTPKETARLLKLHPQTLAMWRVQKKGVILPFIKLGRAVRYRHSDIMAFIEAHSFATSREAPAKPRPPLSS